MSKRYSPQNKLEFKRLFLNDFLNNLTVTDIARKHGVSTASVYRWWREQNELSKQLSVFRDFEINISDAFRTIANHKQTDPWILRDAIFRIAVWIRWPCERHTQRAMLITCASNFLKKHLDSANMNELKKNEMDFLFNYIDLDFLGLIATPDAPYFDFFNIQTYGKARYSDLDFFASVTRYLLSPRALRGLHKKFVSLDNLHYLIENEVFGPSWIMSKRTFQDIWSKRAASFPFLYIERFDESSQRIDWGFEPQAPEFHDDFEYIVENAANIKRYLSHCLWAIEALQARLHPRALQHIRFPIFPVEIEPIPLSVRPYDDAEIAKLKAFGS